jgi:hypothetical protein
MATNTIVRVNISVNIIIDNILSDKNGIDIRISGYTGK